MMLQWPEGDLITRLVADGRVFDQEVVDALMPYIRSDAAVIDAGAFVGQMTLEFAKSAIHVYAFEMNPYLFQLLRANTMGSTNIRIFEKALWSESGKEFGIRVERKDEQTLGAMGLRDKGTHCVHSLKLDDTPTRLFPVSAIKIDVQGADLAVMQGAMRMIREDKPAIIFEYEAGLSEQLCGHKWEDYEKFIDEIGYKIAREVHSTGKNYLILPR